MNNPGVPLMLSTARPIILRLFEQQPQWKRSDLAQRVEAIHLAEGGLKGVQDAANVVKKALRELLHDGLVAKSAPGFWRVNSADPSIEVVDTAGDDVFDEEDEEEMDFQFLDGNNPSLIERQVGSGSESVYLYFNPSDRELAKLKGKDTWPCKIGRCQGDPTIRVLVQGVKTAFSRPPVVGLVMKSLESVYLEKALHASLRLTGAEVPESLGTEWFETSPDRVFAWWTGYLGALDGLRGMSPH